VRKYRREIPHKLPVSIFKELTRAGRADRELWSIRGFCQQRRRQKSACVCELIPTGAPRHRGRARSI